MTAEQANLLLKLQQAGLTMDDLREYLDTHPYDTAALSRYDMAVREYNSMKEEYSNKFSPLTWQCPINSSSEWLWGLTDFPWAQ